VLPCARILPAGAFQEISKGLSNITRRNCAGPLREFLPRTLRIIYQPFETIWILQGLPRRIFFEVIACLRLVD
jgi:hypothetical protein